ncbi:membrane protein, putative [Pseudooceanicola batsensis HTCC2597]|uniref:Membrane protein, putative n=1 Tax=Pseudooceanicola batsensis (strain ATCC BAA-863 / DSM 15984 / KCTC 12145 / HTCC2597) TaxID=252305 RepID=A3U2L9_PSEBH|nr:DMT family transporter [Pseudooceanicola batsensis]EAQ01593.1 membrane protein, putative [Pseudooceanicola batsensis HTCC2597]
MWGRLSQTNRAILLMIGAIFCFTAMDAAAKAISMQSSPVMALWARYTGQMTLVLILVAPRLRSVARTEFPKLQVLRSIFLLGATASFFTGLTFLGLAETTALMDINPVLITLGAAVFLGEKLGPRRILGIAAALVGAMIIIRPGSGVFSWAAIFPLMAAVFYSAYSLATRFVGHREDPWTSLLYAALFGSVVMTGIAIFNWHTPDCTTIALMLVLSVVATLGQLFLIRALAGGEAAMLAPFAYSGLIFATLWGLLFFDEFPDFWTIVGAVVVVAAGLYVWHRETRAAPALARAKADEGH